MDPEIMWMSTSRTGCARADVECEQACENPEPADALTRFVHDARTRSVYDARDSTRALVAPIPMYDTLRHT